MLNIKKVFIEEGLELVSALESYLMDIESNGVSDELINSIFRVMHSLKGGSAMFGFNKLDELAHKLESVFFKIRDNNCLVSDEVINITFRSVDTIKELLSESVEAGVMEKAKQLINDIEIISQKIVDVEAAYDKDTAGPKDNNEGAVAKSYYIMFRPGSEILINGTNPLFIVEELINLSDDYHVIVRNNEIPALDNFDIDKCYTWWELIIYTGEKRENIESAFMFVEDNVDVEIKELADKNVLALPEIKSLINEQTEKDGPVDYKLISAKAQIGHQAENKGNTGKDKKTTRTPNHLPTVKDKISNVKVSSTKLDELMNMVSELVTTQARLHLLSENIDNMELASVSEDITKITRRLRDNAFNIILIPIESVLIKYRRLIRDLSAELNKDVRFVTEGTDTELDKTIIETINEPLLHLIRNAIDHGIEPAEARKKLGKPEQGTIKLKSFYSGSNVLIQISDDGAGIDTEKIKEKAVSKGIISKTANLSEKEILDLIWTPGLSTASVISDISGRGVGMDVVRKKISNVRGDIEIETKKNVGTTFTMKLPLTLSIIDGLLVQVADIKYLIQLSVIDKIHKIKHDELNISFNDIVVINKVQIPYLYLREHFSCQGNPEYEHIIVIEYEDKKVGIVVDNVLGEYQAVLKPLGKHYKDVEIFSGGTILGDGTIALVIDTNKLVREKVQQII